MASDKLALLRRKSAVVWAIVVAAIVMIWAFNSPGYYEDNIGIPAMMSIWLLVCAWVWTDTAYRGKPSPLWMILTLIAGPVALLFYLVTRPVVPDICARCGCQISNLQSSCPCCGYQNLLRRATCRLAWVWNGLLRSVSGGPVDRAKETVKRLTIGCAVAAAFFLLLGNQDPFEFLMLLCVALYWVLVAWWVYLDATWRRMEAVPWGLLTLLTNIFGLVTYLVIRYPEPRICPQCNALLATNLKRCPYCGSEVEPTCPRCQSAVQPDWLFCPACSAQIARPQPPSAPQEEAPTPTVSPSMPQERVNVPPVQPQVCIRGTVVDAATGAPVVGAQVKLDSRSQSRSTLTDSQGVYELPDMPLRPCVLLASAEGYAVDAQAFEPGSGASMQVHFALQPLAVESSSTSSLQ